MCSVVDETVFCENATRITIDTNLISDIASYGMLSAIDGKSKPMFLVYGDEVFRQSGPPEYMSATALTRVIHRDSVKNSLMDKILKKYVGATETGRGIQGHAEIHIVQQHFGM